MEFKVDPTAAAKIAQARHSFPGTEWFVYMNVCDRALISSAARDATVRYLDDMMLSDGGKKSRDAAYEGARNKFARLINAGPDEIAITRNVSDGVNLIAASMPWKAGDNVVISTAIEHPNNLYPWLRLREFGVEIRDIPARGGKLDIPRMLGAIDDRTRILTCASVSFSPGFRADLDTIGRTCRERGVFFMVDGVQAMGILAHDVKRSGIDGLATSTSKGLLGLHGFGFLYCRKEWIAKLKPPSLSRPAVDVPAETPSEMGSFEYRLQADAMRFEVGNSVNYAGAYAADASLGMLLDIGKEAIEAHVVGLTHKLSRGLAALNLPIFGGAPGPDTAHMVFVGDRAESGHDVAADPWIDRLFHHLLENGVVVTVRRGQLRFALHFYNNDADVERVLDLTREFLGSDGNAAPEKARAGAA